MRDPRDRWLLPAGIEETLPPEAARMERARRELLDLFHCWGYDLVMPPLIEYIESLLTGTGPDLDLQTFKLVDQLNGRLMGVRADMTPQVARIDAHHLAGDQPRRLCYVGTVLHTRPDGFSGTRSPIQVGAELYGHDGVESDCEIILLMLETLARAGVREVHLDVGHMGIFGGLAEQARLEEDARAQLFDALQRKARAEIESSLSSLRIEPAVGRRLTALVDLNGAEEVIEEAEERLRGAPPEVEASLHRLRLLGEALRARSELHLHFDLAELRGYRYERGVVFAAFVPGHGQEIARGGRYDGIGEAYGRPRPAIGFSTDLRTLVGLGARRGAGLAAGVFAPWSDEAALVEAIRELRAAGTRVVVELPGQAGTPLAMGCDRALVKTKAGWRVSGLESA